MNLDRRPDNHEAAMARADLYKLANYSMKLFKMIQEGQELEGWVQAKITKAADYVASVYHFMEYEMKSSEYGEKLENSDVYSESVRRAFEQKLMEAKRQAAKVKKEADKVEEGFDDMEKYLKDKKGPQPSGGAGKKSGSRYGGSKQAADKDDEEDEGKKKDKKVKESAKPDYLDFDKDGNKKEPMKKALKDKKIKEGGGKLPDPPDEVHLSKKGSKHGPVDVYKKKTNETLKGGQKKLDADKDGKLEKSDFAALRAGKKVKEGAGCNQTMEGKSCPVHGMKECPMEEAVKKGLYYNVNKRKKAGTSRDKDSPKAPSAQDWKNAAKTAKK